MTDLIDISFRNPYAGLKPDPELAEQLSITQWQAKRLLTKLVGLMRDARIARAMGTAERDRMIVLMEQTIEGLSDTKWATVLPVWSMQHVKNVFFGIQICELICKNTLDSEGRMVLGHELVEFLRVHCFYAGGSEQEEGEEETPPVAH